MEGRLDLAQAEAVADLVAAGSEAAARAARRSLEGEFSKKVEQVVEGLTGLRVWIEAALDFPDEEVDFLAAPELQQRLQAVAADLAALRAAAERGKRLVDGLHVVIAGAPNAGKSSLLNALAGEERAIVTEIAGTTRDLLRERIVVDGIELTLVDTAGLRETPERVEQEGIRRARAELERADLVLAVLDDSAGAGAPLALPPGRPVLWLHNKCDLSGHAAAAETRVDGRHLWLSAQTGEGLDALQRALHDAAGQGEGAEGAFSARARHLEALDRAAGWLERAATQLHHGAGELAAEELRQAQGGAGRNHRAGGRRCAVGAHIQRLLHRQVAAGALKTGKSVRHVALGNVAALTNRPKSYVLKVMFRSSVSGESHDRSDLLVLQRPALGHRLGLGPDAGRLLQGRAGRARR